MIVDPGRNHYIIKREDKLTFYDHRDLAWARYRAPGSPWAEIWRWNGQAWECVEQRGTPPLPPAPRDEPPLLSFWTRLRLWWNRHA